MTFALGSCKCQNSDQVIQGGSCKDCSDPAVAALNLAECIGSAVPDIPVPVPEGRIDVDWSFTNDFPGDSSLLEQISKPDENSIKVYMKFESTEEVDINLLKTFNYQKNLQLSDPETSKKIDKVTFETTFFDTFASITLVNIHKHVSDTTKEL